MTRCEYQSRAYPPQVPSVLLSSQPKEAGLPTGPGALPNLMGCGEGLPFNKPGQKGSFLANHLGEAAGSISTVLPGPEGRIPSEKWIEMRDQVLLFWGDQALLGLSTPIFLPLLHLHFSGRVPALPGSSQGRRGMLRVAGGCHL